MENISHQQGSNSHPEGMRHCYRYYSNKHTPQLGDRDALQCHWNNATGMPLKRNQWDSFQASCILPVAEEQSRTRDGQSTKAAELDQPQCQCYVEGLQRAVRRLGGDMVDKEPDTALLPSGKDVQEVEDDNGR